MKENYYKFLKQIDIILMIILIILILIHLVNATTPLDQLVQNNNSRVLVDLTNLNHRSATNIAQLHRELVKTERWQMADLGYYCSYTINAVQTYEDVDTDAIKKFLNSSDELPNNIGNINLNFTDINKSSNIPYY